MKELIHTQKSNYYKEEGWTNVQFALPHNQKSYNRKDTRRSPRIRWHIISQSIIK